MIIAKNACAETHAGRSAPTSAPAKTLQMQYICHKKVKKSLPSIVAQSVVQFLKPWSQSYYTWPLQALGNDYYDGHHCELEVGIKTTSGQSTNVQEIVALLPKQRGCLIDEICLPRGCVAWNALRWKISSISCRLRHQRIRVSIATVPR